MIYSTADQEKTRWCCRLSWFLMLFGRFQIVDKVRKFLLIMRYDTFSSGIGQPQVIKNSIAQVTNKKQQTETQNKKKLKKFTNNNRKKYFFKRNGEIITKTDITAKVVKTSEIWSKKRIVEKKHGRIEVRRRSFKEIELSDNNAGSRTMQCRISVCLTFSGVRYRRNWIRLAIPIPHSVFFPVSHHCKSVQNSSSQ